MWFTTKTFEAYLQGLPEHVQRLPEVTAHLIQNGSLERGGATLSALQFVQAELTRSLEATDTRATPFSTPEALIVWLRYAKNRFGLWSSYLAALRGAPSHWVDVIAELESAVWGCGVKLVAEPHRTRNDPSVADAPLARFGPRALRTLPGAIECPCASHQQGSLHLYQQDAGLVFYYDEREELYPADLHPWHINPSMPLTLANDVSLGDRVLFSDIGTDFSHAENVLTCTLEAFDRVTPDEWYGDVMVATLRSPVPLGEYASTVWRFTLRADGQYITHLSSLGSGIPPLLRDRETWIPVTG